ncbi:DUF456 domain-containing protein [Natrialbaceae archaeon A-arb3/5]
MSDRSDELTESRDGDPDSTADLLEETDQLLSGSTSSERTADRREPATRDAPATETDESGSWLDSSDDSAATDTGSQAGTSSGLRDRLLPSRSIGEYFSPKAFLALTALIGVGLFAGDTVLPLAGRLVGMFVVTFVVGLVTSKRRYLETIVAGTAAGAVTTVALDPMLAAVGSGRTLLAIGAAVGLVASVAGYYFGRDLRNGLVRDIDGS